MVSRELDLEAYAADIAKHININSCLIFVCFIDTGEKEREIGKCMAEPSKDG